MSGFRRLTTPGQVLDWPADLYPEERPLQPEPAPSQESTLKEAAPARVGRYTLVQPLGKGATGEVFRARDPEIGRDVAVKILRVPEGLSGEESAEWEQRFLQEARAAGGLSHPGIVPVHDVGRSEDGRPFIVMELIEGLSLEAVMRRRPCPEPSVVLGWGAQMAEALDAAHRRGVVHRDIKPANILIDEEGRARIADFGIARLSGSELTRTGLFLGSPAYAAPEQLRGEPVDARADLFSLAATLYAALTTKKPFAGDDLASLAYAICHREPVPPRHLNPALPQACDAILRKALAKDPAHRYQTGREMAIDLRAAAAGASVTPGSPPLEVVARARRLWMEGWSRSPRMRFAMIAGVVILIAAIGLGAMIIAHRIEERRRSPGQRLKKAFRSLVSEVVPPERPDLLV